ncbi:MULTISPECIES: hypothetical protein [unclassified Gilliamella]|uniref:hypothetical protein n=1 Tax=unclassified Gilliamella TaxID=2685620 RepID=UPI001327FA33|nr:MULTISPECIES: hypothetical protein [unclassified Gilliamella]MWN30995.1 hypothetical protein [Gilliamella sp. Pra-s60]MWP28440.1 hypothetical protein [Gilliamella sp. Pra-s54]
MTTLNIQNINIEIQDLNENSDCPQLGMIQVSMSFYFKDKHYCFSLQTSNTFDAGAVSSSLVVYKDEDQYDEFVEAVSKDSEVDSWDAEELVEEFFTKEISDHAQELFDSYVNKNYLTQDFNGMDANSLSNELRRVHD